MIALAVAAVVLAQAGEPAEIERSVLGFADHLLEAGDTVRAASEYERFLYLCGDCDKAAYAELRIADCWKRGGDPLKAATQYRQVISTHTGTPEAVEAARLLPDALESAGEPASASDAYLAYVVAHPEDEKAGELGVRAVRTALRAHDPDRVKASVAGAPAGAVAYDYASLLDAIVETRPSRRNPAVGGALAILLPGAGHAYAGRWRDAIMSFVVNGLFISGAVIAWDQEQHAIAGVLGGLEIFWYGGNVVGAINAAHRYNAGARDAHWRGLERKYLPLPAVSVAF